MIELSLEDAKVEIVEPASWVEWGGKAEDLGGTGAAAAAYQTKRLAAVKTYPMHDQSSLA
jgi:hypothetical protein